MNPKWKKTKTKACSLVLRERLKRQSRLRYPPKY
jgi:hypothetical protein